MDIAPRCVEFAAYMWKHQATVTRTAEHFGEKYDVVLTHVNETIHGLIRAQVRSDLYQRRNAEPLLQAGELMIQRKGDRKQTRSRIQALLKLLESLRPDESLTIDPKTLPPVGTHESRLPQEYRGNGGK